MGLIYPVLALPFALPALLLNGWIIFVAKILASLPFSSAILPAFPFVLVILAYAGLALLVYRLKKKNPTHALQLQVVSRTHSS